MLSITAPGDFELTVVKQLSRLIACAVKDYAKYMPRVEHIKQHTELRSAALARKVAIKRTKFLALRELPRIVGGKLLGDVTRRENSAPYKR